MANTPGAITKNAVQQPVYDNKKISHNRLFISLTKYFLIL